MSNLGTQEAFGFGNDPIVIRDFKAGIIGGKILDVTGFNEEFVRAGHWIIRNTTKDTYKPMPVSSGAYGSLPSGHEYVGVAQATKATKDAQVAIMYSGEVNDVASPYTFTSDQKAAFLAAVPTIAFKHD